MLFPALVLLPYSALALTTLRSNMESRVSSPTPHIQRVGDNIVPARQRQTNRKQDGPQLTLDRFVSSTWKFGRFGSQTLSPSCRHSRGARQLLQWHCRHVAEGTRSPSAETPQPHRCARIAHVLAHYVVPLLHARHTPPPGVLEPPSRAVCASFGT